MAVTMIVDTSNLAYLWAWANIGQCLQWNLPALHMNISLYSQRKIPLT